ncbi:MAG TPA: MarC family protein [Trebonia sp.]|jgi:multiple antibiotic resistance protein|nr:MarC family protein [Trebonia sp.]
MDSLNLADTFVTFLALIGPQKVLLSFGRLARTLDDHQVREVAAATAATAAIVGALCALTAPWVVTFFHIGAPELNLAAGLLFIIYAIGLVLGIHFDTERPHEAAALIADEDDAEDADPMHPLTSGFRAMLLPFVVSPIAIAADLEESISAGGWGGRWTVAGAFALVALVDMLFTWVFAPLLRRMHDSVLEVLSRLLGTLLAAVGVGVFLDGLSDLGVVLHGH